MSGDAAYRAVGSETGACSPTVDSESPDSVPPAWFSGLSVPSRRSGGGRSSGEVVDILLGERGSLGALSARVREGGEVKREERMKEGPRVEKREGES